MTATAQIEQWYGCYGDRGDWFLRASNVHPAKMAVGLCARIFEHGRERGYWKPGDTILDPMSGIGTTAVVGGALGYNIIAVELEPRFVALLKENIAYAAARRFTRKVRIQIIHGDARDLALMLAWLARNGDSVAGGGEREASLPRRPTFDAPEGGGINVRGYGPDGADKVGDRTYSKRTVDGALSSPPFTDQLPCKDPLFAAQLPGAGVAMQSGYSPDAAIASPPYSDQQITGSSNFYSEKDGRGMMARDGHALDGYDGAAGAITSPPYSDARLPPDATTSARIFEEKRIPDNYGKSGAQICNLRDPKHDIDAVLSSPPYSNLVSTAEQRGKPSSGWLEERGIHQNVYGREPGQIGNLPDGNAPAHKETYLGAMLRVYHQLYRVLRPGGVVVLVTKNPVKDKQIRRLDADTIRLMEACGFRLIERHAAMLAEETQLPSLFDAAAPITKRKERKSFFKRLHERRNPHLRIDHEDVLWFQKP